MSNWNSADAEAVRRGATIRALREAYGVPGQKLAAEAGISYRYLTYIEGGKRGASLKVCRRIADYLKVPLAAITIEGYERGDSEDGSAA
jgi:transcriptional regulator with XRE-family HTH domain